MIRNIRRYANIYAIYMKCYEQNKKPLNRKNISKNRAKIQFLSTNPISVSSQHTRSPHTLKRQLHIIKQYGIAIQSIINKILKLRFNNNHEQNSIIEMSACIVTTLNFYQCLSHVLILRCLDQIILIPSIPLNV